MFIEKLSTEATLTFRSLEGLTILVSQQREGILNLHSTLARLLKASGPLSPEDANAINLEIEVLSDDRQFSLKLTNMQAMLDDLGSFVLDRIQEAGVQVMAEVVKYLATCSENLISDVIAIFVERDSSNEVASKLPQVLPHQLVALRGREFAHFVRTQSPHLKF